jgi:hypothetical protein
MMIHFPKLVISSSTFWFWEQPYDAQKTINFIREMNLPFNGIDIWIFATKGAKMPVFDKLTIDYLQNLEIISAHTDFYDIDWQKNIDLKDFSQRLNNIFHFCKEVGIKDLIIHADFLVNHPRRILALLIEKLPNIRISFEFMDKNKLFGNHPDHFRRIFQLDDRFGLVVDLAHLQDFQNEFDWKSFFSDQFLRKHISFIHVSSHSSILKTNFYENYGFPNINAVHSLSHFDKSLFPSELMRNCRDFPMVIEGIVPPGEIGKELLVKEINWIRNQTG